MSLTYDEGGHFVTDDAGVIHGCGVLDKHACLQMVQESQEMGLDDFAEDTALDLGIIPKTFWSWKSIAIFCVGALLTIRIMED